MSLAKSDDARVLPAVSVRAAAWLHEMVALALQPGAEAVGAPLVFR